MHYCKIFYLTIILLLIGSTYAISQPSNDRESNAIELQHTDSEICDSGSTLNATGSDFSVICGFPNDDVWYTFVATKNTIQIKITGDDDFTPAFELYSGFGGPPLTCIGPVGNQAIFNGNNLNVGEIYNIRLFHSAESASSTPDFEICLSMGAPAPQNDDCSTATNLQCNTPLTNQSNAAASSNMPENTCSDARAVVWYKFTPDGYGYASLRITNANFNYNYTVLSSNDCTAYTPIECGFGDFNYNPFTTYYLLVYGNDFTSDPIGTFTIELKCEERTPPNDNYQEAIELKHHSICFATRGSSVGATQSFQDCQGGLFGQANDDVWYRFEATADSAIIDVDGQANYRAILEFYYDFPGNSNPNTICESFLPVTISNLTQGSNYYFRIYDDGGFTSPPSSWEYDVCVYGGTASPANDDCQNAVEVIQKTNKDFSKGTSQFASGTLSGCTGFSDDDVWYKFVANSSEALIEIKTEFSSGYDPVLEVLDGCSNSTTLLCVDENGSSTGENGYVTGLTPGQIYYYRVYHWWNNGAFDPSAWNFEHTVYGGASAPCNTVNIEFSNTQVLSGEYRDVFSISIQPSSGGTFVDSIADVSLIAPNGIALNGEFTVLSGALFQADSRNCGE